MTNEKLCADIEHAKLIAETGLMDSSVNPDGYWNQYSKKDYKTGISTVCRTFFSEKFLRLGGVNDKCVGHGGEEHGIPYASDEEIIPTYRLDKILAKLPECLYESIGAAMDMFYQKLSVDKIGTYLPSRILGLMNDCRWSRGQAAANVAAKLLHLLWKEKLI